MVTNHPGNGHQVHQGVVSGIHIYIYIYIYFFFFSFYETEDNNYSYLVLCHLFQHTFSKIHKKGFGIIN